MTLDEAKQKMDSLRAEYDSLWSELAKEGALGVEQDEIELDRAKKCAEKKREMDRHGQICAAYPHIRPFLWCWMVDVHGTEPNACSEEEMHEAVEFLNAKNRDEFLGRVGGSLAQQVSRFLADELQMHSTDCGGGCGGWDIGTPCNDAECAALIASLHQRFAKAITAGLLNVQVKFWGWKFRVQKEVEPVSTYTF
jgi:hypothetical protein